MDKVVPCFCGKNRIDPDDANIVLNDVPICNRDCLAKAEKSLSGKDTVRVKKSWSWNGA